MKKKFWTILLLSIVTLCIFTGCDSYSSNISNESNGDKLNIVATLFPQYDFARAIVGDKGKVSMLMPPGIESHSFEPTPSDIIKINKADLFIYTGKYMESWAQSIIDGIENKNIKILDVSQNIELDKGKDDDHQGHSEEIGHNHEYDPHIWTSPVNAKVMVDNILNQVCELDPSNADYYTKNAEGYKSQLDELDNDFKNIFKNSKRDKIIFAGKFALHYFAEEYGMDYDAAFDSCSSEAEPSVKVITELVDEIEYENIPVIYYAELTDPKVARAISEETGAEMLLLHSCHNVSKDEFDKGVTYVSLMRENAKNLKKGLN